MLSVFFLTLLIIGLTTSGFIVVSHFPQLVKIKIADDLKLQREALFKEKIISSRLKRNILSWFSFVSNFLRPVYQFLNDFFKNKYKKLLDLKEQHKNDTVNILKTGAKNKIDTLFKTINNLIKNEEWQEAEKKLIQIIELDHRNVLAFKKLGEFYLEQKKYEEARQTFEHAIKLGDDKDDESFFDLASINKALGNTDEAILNIKRAREIQPNNPRYLDTMFELAIIKKDKILALEAYKKLEEVNPENAKLAQMKEDVREL